MEILQSLVALIEVIIGAVLSGIGFYLKRDWYRESYNLN